MKDTRTAFQSHWFFRFFAVLAAAGIIPLAFLYFDFITHPLAPDPNWGSVAYRLFVALALVPAGLAVSLLVLRRAPGNVTGLFLLIYTTSLMYGTLRVDTPFPWLYVFSRLSDQGWWLLPLYFPDGEAYPTRFRRWIRLHSVLMVAFYIGALVFYPTINMIPGVQRPFESANPLYVPALVPFHNPFTTIQGVLWLSSVLLIVPSILLRFRASHGITRQQIKWFVSVFAVLILIFLLLAQQFADLKTGALDPAGFGIFGIAILVYQMVLVPVTPFLAVGVAILRHNLYDIDIIIRRTLVYSILTASLALTYFGSVIIVQQVLRPLTASSDLAIVLSTLAIAALFNPLRHRIQNTIDRRFFRRKYDAQKTLEAFSIATRDEVDLDRLQAELIGVVQDAMQPTKVALWLRTAEGEAK